MIGNISATESNYKKFSKPYVSHGLFLYAMHNVNVLFISYRKVHILGPGDGLVVKSAHRSRRGAGVSSTHMRLIATLPPV